MIHAKTFWTFFKGEEIRWKFLVFSFPSENTFKNIFIPYRGGKKITLWRRLSLYKTYKRRINCVTLKRLVPHLKEWGVYFRITFILSKIPNSRTQRTMIAHTRKVYYWIINIPTTRTPLVLPPFTYLLVQIICNNSCSFSDNELYPRGVPYKNELFNI